MISILLQNVFVKVNSVLAKSEGRFSLSTRIYNIATNTANDLFRRVAFQGCIHFYHPTSIQMQNNSINMKLMEHNDIHGIKSIWNEYYDQLLNFILKRVSEKATAEDILQDVFIKIISNIESLHDSASLKNWLFQITRNTIIDYFRDSRTTESISTDLPEEYDETNEDIMEEVSSWISPFIRGLPKKYRDAMILSEINGMSQKDLAVHLGISYAGARSRVQRGRSLLKKELTQCCIFHTDKYGNIMDVNRKSDDCDNCNS